MHPWSKNPLKTILCLGAHSDDIEIGCGATIAKWLVERPSIAAVHWVVFSAEGERAAEARSSAERLLRSAREKTISIHNFPDACFPFVGMEIREQMRRIAADVSPDLIFTHRLEDRHQDHKLLAELTWNTFRDHPILEYEIPKYEGDLGAPNCFVALDQTDCRRKCEHLLEHFPSQRRRSWFTASTFESLLRIRGVECAAPGGYAEAFTCRKWMI